jgi:hypothetical protein
VAGFDAVVASDYDVIFALLAAERFDACPIVPTQRPKQDAHLSARVDPSDPSRSRMVPPSLIARTDAVIE